MDKNASFSLMVVPVLRKWSALEVGLFVMGENYKIVQNSCFSLLLFLIKRRTIGKSHCPGGICAKKESIFVRVICPGVNFGFTCLWKCSAHTHTGANSHCHCCPITNTQTISRPADQTPIWLPPSVWMI
jgi:hypothetical protein